ncbi:hypothetical protein DSECCO2_643240 [anaerobic digester metagenome]
MIACRSAVRHVSGFLGKIRLAVCAGKELHELPRSPLPPLVGARHGDDGSSYRHTVANLARDECRQYLERCTVHYITHRSRRPEYHGDLLVEKIVMRGGGNCTLVLEYHILPEFCCSNRWGLRQMHDKVFIADLSIKGIHCTLEIPVSRCSTHGEADAVLDWFSICVDFRQLLAVFTKFVPGCRSSTWKSRFCQHILVDIEKRSTSQRRQCIQAIVVITVGQ